MSAKVDGASQKAETPQEVEDRDATTMIASGVGIGVIGALSAAIGAAACPVCVVAAPALVGFGAYRKWRAARRRTDGGDGDGE